MSKDRFADRDAWEPDDLLALALSRPPEALVAAREVLRGVPTAVQASVAHQAAGVVLRDFGDIGQAVLELRASCRYARKAGDSDRQADALATLGVALVMAGQVRRGLSTLDQGVRMSSRALTGRILIRKAHANWLVGKNLVTLQAARTAVETLTGTGDTVWEARAYNHCAMALLALGDIDGADQNYRRCEALFAECGQQLEFATARQERGAIAFARGDLPTALTYLDDAQQIIDELGVLEPELFVNRCAVLLAAGMSRDALVVAEAAITRIETQHGSATRRAELSYSAAVSGYAAGDLDAAERRAAEALRLFRNQQRHTWQARAELVFLQARYAKGDARPGPLLRRVAAAAERLDRLDPDQATHAHLLAGRIALTLTDVPRAQHHLRAAARSRRRGVLAAGVGWLAQATLHESEGRPRAMLSSCRQGLRQIEIRRSTLGATEMRATVTMHGAELAALALRHAVRSGRARDFLDWSERWRATVTALPPVRSSSGDALMADLAALRHLAGRLDTAAVGYRDGAAPALHRERRRLEAAIRQRTLRTPGRSLDQAVPFRSADLSGQLDDTDLVELTDVDGELYAVVATRRGIRLLLVGSTARATRSVAQSLFALRREASRRGTHRLDLGSVGQRLQTDLLGESARLLGSPSLVIVPTGLLHAVPWSLLPSLRGRAIAVAPSAAAWLRARHTVPPQEGRTVLVGGPGLSTGTEEVRRLAVRYPQATVLAGADATVERVMSAMDGAWLVHIAAHGTFRADSPLFSAVQLDDGPLTVYDLERLGRAPYRVVMSSCSSAVSAPTGADELLGLVSALISLGSAGVVASVVPVNDPATVPLMLALHSHLHHESSLPAALALAQQAATGEAGARCTADSFVALGV